MTQTNPRFPSVIRLHDGLDALDEPNRRTLTLLWWGLGFLSIFAFAPHLLMSDFKSAVESGSPESAEPGAAVWIVLAAGIVLLGSWLATRVYWVRAAVLPRRRAGLGWEYNPVRFARVAAKLREIARHGGKRDPRSRRIHDDLAREVQAHERWLSLKDADSYRAWLAYRDREGV